MTLSADEFMRRFLLHVLPSGFHRIRHYGLLANAGRRENLSKVRELLHVAPKADAEPQSAEAPVDFLQPTFVCPECGAAMIVVKVLMRGQPIREGVALCRGDLVFSPTRQRNNGCINPGARHLSDDAVRLAGLYPTSSPSAALRIPIVA